MLQRRTGFMKTLPPYPTVSALCCCLLVAGLAGFGGCAPKATDPAKPPLQKVMFVTPVEEQVTEYEEFTGRTAPEKMVELRSRVNGYLKEVNFEDGAEVKKGDVLFLIEKDPFLAERDQAAAAVDQFKARVDRLTRQLERMTELATKNATSANDVDLVRFDRAEALASQKAAEAQLQTAMLNLDFAEITAPMDGRISRRLVDPGNLVQADTTSLATIVPLGFVYIYFDMDERTVLRLRRLVQDGKLNANYMTATYIDVALADSNDQFIRQAKIDFEDNQIDAATGTLRVRAVVENKDRFLSPGMFVRIRYPIGDAASALLIPEEAIGSDQGRPYVYLVDESGKVVNQPLPELGPLVDGRRVVKQGIKLGDRVIVTGLQRIKKDQQVEAVLFEPDFSSLAQAIATATRAAVAEPNPEKKPAGDVVSLKDLEKKPPTITPAAAR